MCNAWNHPPSCTCGWGGLGHLGGLHEAHAYEVEYWRIPPIIHTSESYTNPNALCPVCGTSVFFYQSPNGGRVFFDELGPPWLKHPCTNSGSIPKNIDIFSTPSNEHNYKWQIDGWSPFFITLVSGIDNSTLKIIGTSDSKELTLYIQRIVIPHSLDSKLNPNPISEKNIAYIKKVGNKTYELSLITIFGESITIYAFLSLSDNRKFAKYTV